MNPVGVYTKIRSARVLQQFGGLSEIPTIQSVVNDVFEAVRHKRLDNHTTEIASRLMNNGLRRLNDLGLEIRWETNRGDFKVVQFDVKVDNLNHSMTIIPLTE